MGDGPDNDARRKEPRDEGSYKLPAQLLYKLRAHIIEFVHVEGLAYAVTLDGVRRPLLARYERKDIHWGGNEPTHVQEERADVVNLSELLECLEAGAEAAANSIWIEFNTSRSDHFNHYMSLSVVVWITDDNSIAVRSRREVREDSYY